MSRDRASRRLPVVMSYIFALMLTMMPLPEVIAAFRPDWIAMLVIYWAMQLPRTWSVGSAWIIGVVLDVARAPCSANTLSLFAPSPSSPYGSICRCGSFRFRK